VSDDRWLGVVRLPYMVGVYLGVNAFPDVWMVVDGPDCLFFKAEYVHGSQDLHSTLLSPTGRHRVAHTLADTVNVVTDREPDIADLIRRVASRDEAAMVLLTAMPMASITGSQYDRIGREVAAAVGKPILDVPARSLDGDWLDGYAEVLDGVARGIPLPAADRDPGAVAVVGMLVDRTEADRLADVVEVRRMLRQGLGLDVAAVWPSNAPLAALAGVARAGTVVSLPYGRKAARTLARRTGATLVEADLPVGLEASARLLAAVGEATGRADRAGAFVRAEREAVAAAIDVARSRGLGGRALAVITDPHLAAGLVSFAADVGASVSAVLSTRHPSRPVAGLPGREAFGRDAGMKADLCLCTTRGIEVATELGMPWMEIGFPSYGTHALAPVPTLGFRGAIALSGRLWNHLRFLEDRGGLH
jgi:nitrogenase molybdenum-iron protein alpha/beta subunit